MSDIEDIERRLDQNLKRQIADFQDRTQDYVQAAL